MIAWLSPPASNLTPLLQAGLKRFNVDEPYLRHQNFGTAFIDQVDAALPTDGKLYVSDYHMVGCDNFDHGPIHNAITSLIDDYAPLVSSKTKFGTHSQWQEVDGVGAITDPRDQWDQLNNGLSGQAKFEHGWVRTIKDVWYLFGSSVELATSQQMQWIWGHANSVGANTMFINVEGTDHLYYSNVLNNVLYAGWQAGGWLEAEQESTQAQFCCTTNYYDPDSCTFREIIHSGQFRWI